MKKKLPKPAAKNVPGGSEPSPYELAMLAIAISQESTLDKLVFGIRNQGSALSAFDHSPELWVKEALALWLTARAVLGKWRTNPAEVFPETTLQPRQELEPETYPVTLDKFLKLMLPTLIGRSGERYGRFRDYLAFRLRNPTPPNQYWADPLPGIVVPADRVPFDCCHPRIVWGTFEAYSSEKAEPAKPPEPSKDAVDEYFTLWNTQGIPDRNSFRYHARYFREWYQPTHAAEIADIRRDAGARGLASPKRPKNNSKRKG